MRPDLAQPLRLAAIFLLFGTGWMLLSDSLLLTLTIDGQRLGRLYTAKSLLFVLVSTLLIFYVALKDRRAQLALLHSLTRQARQLQQAQRNAALGNWEYDGRFHWSEEALRLLCRQGPAAPCGRETVLNWLHPADRQALHRALEALLEHGRPLALGVRPQQQRDGMPTWLMLRGEADADGHVFGTVQDISQQKRDEENLRESEQRFRQLFEQTPRIAVQGYDRERRVIYWNQASVQLYGYQVHEAMGQRLEDLIIPPAQRQTVIDDINRWLAGGPPIPPAELQLQRKGGSRVWVYSSHLMLRNRLAQKELYCIDIDLSAQKRAHLELEASESRYRDLVEQLTEAIFLTDDNACLCFINPAWQMLTGHSPGSSLRQSLAEFFASEDQQEIGEKVAEILGGLRARWQGDYRIRCASGQLRWVSLQLSPGETAVGGLHGSLSDIHAQRQTQQLQEARNAVLDQLLAQRPLSETLEGIARRLEALSPEIRVAILLLDASECLRLLAAPNLPEHYRQALDGLPLGAAGFAECTPAGTLPDQPGPRWLEARPLDASADVRASWSLPFVDDAGQALGTFLICYRKLTRPSAEDIALATDFTRLAGLAVQQQRREAQRQEIEQRFRATFEHAAVGIAHLAPDGRWLRVNELLCQMLGYSRDELMQLTFQDLTDPADLGADLDLVRQLLAGEIDHYSMEKRYHRRDGSLLWAQLSATLQRHANGEPHYFISVVEDISLRKGQEQALQQAATVFDSTHEAVVVVDAERRILTSNPAFSEITGLSQEQALGHRLPLRLGSSLERNRYREVWRTVLRQGHWQGELSSRRQDGSVFPLWLTASLVRGRDRLRPQFVLVFTDLSLFKENQERLAHLANFDPLTDLPNRLYAHERLDHALQHAKRHHERVAVMFLDLDHFKTINDSLGHPVGDELLIAVARRLQQRLRNEDTLARLGGDEFLIVLENLQSADEAAHIASALLELFDRPLVLGEGHEAYVGASIGISFYPNDGESGDELIRNADAALYQAKAEGRHTFRFYTEALTTRAHSRLTLESQLRRALQNDEFVLHYQPLVDARSGVSCGVEALVRWRSDVGMVAPGEFISLAEETGLIVPIGNWVLQEACQQAQAWIDQGLALGTLAVNLSPRQFHQTDLLSQVHQALTFSGLAPEHLELEITEGALMEDVDQAQATLAGLKALGVRLAVDDFGTGYSSLAYLRRFPLDKLKVDQSFMRGVPEDRGNLEIVGTIVALARSLKLKVLAEGIETPAQLAVLRQLGCDQCQGYLFSPPLSADQYLAWRHRDRQSVV